MSDKRLEFKNINPPKWILKLKAGRYYIDELMELTGLANSSISVTLKRYGAKVQKELCHTNLVRNVFIWDGYNPDYRYKEHIKKIKNLA